MGRVAITGVAQRFMTDFPEMKVIMDRIEIRGPGSLPLDTGGHEHRAWGDRETGSDQRVRRVADWR